MKINILNIKKTIGNDAQLTETMELSSENTSEYTFCQPLEAEYNLKIIGSHVLFKCVFSVEVKFLCTRCLEEFNKKISGEFEALYLNNKDYKLYLSAEENDNTYSENEVTKERLENDTIDTYNIVRENVILAIPYVNRCSDNCKLADVDIDLDVITN